MREARSLSAARIGRLARKELSEILRDRRTIVTLIAMPLLLYPLMAVAFQQFFIATTAKVDIRICFEREQESWKEVFIKRLAEGGAILKERANQTRRGGEIKASESELRAIQYGVEDSGVAEEKLRNGDYDILVRLKFPRRAEGRKIGRDRAYTLELLFEPHVPGAVQALRYIEARFAAVDERDLLKRLDLPGEVEPITVLAMKRIPLWADEDKSTNSLASLIPLILVLMTVTGAVYPAIDLTAGERERNTLEILVAAPVSRFELLTAKYLSVLAVALLTSLVNLTCMMLTMSWSGMGLILFGEEGLTLSLVFVVFLLLLLFATFFSALLLCLTSFARSFKEAQAYLIPLMLMSLAPGILAMQPDLKLGSLAVVPLVNVVLLARDVFLRGPDPVAAAVVVATTLLYALAALSLAARVFGAESVLYSEQSGWSDLLRRPEEPSDVGSLPAALWCLALMAPLSFAARAAILRLNPGAETMAWLMAGLNVLLFVLLPLAAADRGRVRLWSGFALQPPRPAALLAGLLLGASTWIFVALVSSQVELPEAIKAAADAAAERIRAMGMLALLPFVTAAAVEEFFFRGFLFQALRAHCSAWLTIVLTAILFGVTHAFFGGALGLGQLLPSTLLGLVLGVVCWRSGSLWPSLLMHAVHNAIQITLLIRPRMAASVQSELPLALTAASFLALTGVLLLWAFGPWRARSGGGQQLEESAHPGGVVVPGPGAD